VENKREDDRECTDKSCNEGTDGDDGMENKGDSSDNFIALENPHPSQCGKAIVAQK